MKVETGDLTVIMFHFKFNKAEGVAVGVGMGVISTVGLTITWVTTGVKEVLGRGRMVPEGMGTKREAKTPRKVPKRIRAMPMRIVRNREEDSGATGGLIGVVGAVGKGGFSGFGGRSGETIGGRVSEKIGEGVAGEIIGAADSSCPQARGGV